MKFKDLLEKQFLARNTVAPSFENAGFHKIATDIMDCATFKNYALCLDCDTVHFNGASVCHNRFCPICNLKRSRAYFSRFVPVIKDLLSKGYYVNMLNFTIVDDSDLSHALSVLTKSFRYIQHDNKEYSKIFNSMFVGGVSSKEVKLGENSKLWHPHIHCLVVKDHYSQDFEYLKYIWNDAVRVCGGNPGSTDSGKFGSVFVCSIIDKQGLNTDYIKSVEMGVLETMKYITKFDYQLDNSLLPELVRALKGIRTVNTWGCLRNVSTNVESDINKSYTELVKQCCAVCGGHDFFEFCSTKTLQNVADFDMDKAELVQTPKYNLGHNELTPLFKLRDDLVIGQKYGNVVYSQLQAQFVGKFIKAEHGMNNTYFVRKLDEVNVRVDDSGKAIASYYTDDYLKMRGIPFHYSKTYKEEIIAFSQEMFA